MIFVFLSGWLGFFVFDAYRVRVIYDATGVRFLTFKSKLGLAIHLAVYIAAGIFAIAINLDVVIDWPALSAPPNEVIGPLMRGFALGLAGPAGLSKNALSKAKKRGAGDTTMPQDIGTLDATTSIGRRAKAYLELLFLRRSW